jgi:hypothetical protein
MSDPDASRDASPVGAAVPPPAVPESAAGTAATDELAKTLRRIEARLTRLEQYLEFPPLPDESTTTVPASPAAQAAAAQAAAESSEAGLEMRIGEFWLARVGVLALIVGFGFLVTYPFATLPALVPCLFGYVAVAGLFALARHWEDSLPHISRILFSGALFLLYFATLRLHFFSAHPFVASKAFGLALLVAVLGVQFYVAARRRSELVAGLVVVLALATGLISDTAPFALGMVVAVAVVVVILLRQFNWQRLANGTLVLAYLTHLEWLLNNPVLGHPMQAVKDPQFNLAYLAVYAGVFAAANCFHYQDPGTLVARILRTILNGAGAMAIGNLNALAFFPSRFPLINLIISAGCLATAMAYWVHRRSLYSTSIYACFGYMAMSAAIIAGFRSPDLFLWLAWQSLLVAATAVWFRSKIIIVTNVFIYAGIYLAYLFTAPAAGGVNLSFAVAALVTARVLNWQKDQLELRTEVMRNFYLATACVIVPYGLYHTVPKAWVSASWLLVAVAYFIVSLLLHNRKYRWMAIFTILGAVVYTFIVDLARLEPIYRISSFLVLGVVLLVVSVFYARSRARNPGGPA